MHVDAIRQRQGGVLVGHIHTNSCAGRRKLESARYMSVRLQFHMQTGPRTGTYSKAATENMNHEHHKLYIYIYPSRSKCSYNPKLTYYSQFVSAQRKAANQDSAQLGLPAIIDVIWPFYAQIKALCIESVFIGVKLHNIDTSKHHKLTNANISNMIIHTTDSIPCMLQNAATHIHSV